MTKNETQIKYSLTIGSKESELIVSPIRTIPICSGYEDSFLEIVFALTLYKEAKNIPRTIDIIGFINVTTKSEKIIKKKLDRAIFLIFLKI